MLEDLKLVMSVFYRVETYHVEPAWLAVSILMLGMFLPSETPAAADQSASSSRDHQPSEDLISRKEPQELALVITRPLAESQAAAGQLPQPAAAAASRGTSTKLFPPPSGRQQQWQEQWLWGWL